MAHKKYYTVTLTLPDGTRKYFRGKTKREAEKKRDEAKLMVGMGVNLSDSTTFAGLTDTWFELYIKGQLHKRSEETILNTNKRYILPVLGNMVVRDIKPIHIQQLMCSVKDYSKSTQKKVLQNTKRILKVAVKNGLLMSMPIDDEVKAKGSNPREKVPLTKAQSETLLDAIKGTRAYPLVLVLLNAGLRIGEALGLMWSDIDFDEGEITVNRSIVYPEDNRRGEINSEMKTENAHRTIPLPWHVVDVLRKEKAVSNSLWVFSMRNGEFLSYDSFRSLWQIIDYRTINKHRGNVREFVPRTLDFNVHPHLLRHTCITRWFEKGLDIKQIQYLAGHASTDVTLEIYTHYQENERRKQTAEMIRA